MVGQRSKRQQPSARRRPGWAGVAAGPLLLATLSGCGKEGPPLPPLPRGPNPPAAVAARQIGRRAFVGFNVPPAKGPKPSQQPVRAELVRVSYMPGLQPPNDPDAFRRRGDVVGRLAADPFVEDSRLVLEDLDLTSLPDGGTGYTLRYGVRLFDRRGRPSPLVLTRDLVLERSIGAPQGLITEPTADGVRLAWDTPSGVEGAAYNVYRSSPDAAWPETPLNPAPLAATDFLDSQVTTGERYTYTVRVSLGAAPPFREGEPSESREVLAEDRFAPGAPGGLVAVQEGLGVRLFWDPNPERDLEGYVVERSVDGGEWSRITPEPVHQPTFLDEAVRVGQRLSYRVVAVDHAEPPNVGQASSSVEIQIGEEPVEP